MSVDIVVTPTLYDGSYTEALAELPCDDFGVYMYIQFKAAGSLWDSLGCWTKASGIIHADCTPS